MKKFSLSILFVLLSSLFAFTYAQVDVTFQVDMSQVGTVSSNGVTVAGDFQVAAGYPFNWEPGVIFLTEGTPGIYSVTVQLPAGTYAFKYINGITWNLPDEPEQVPGCCIVNGNRELVVGNDPVVLDAVYFGSCHVAGAATYDVTFKVNMADQTVTDGVFIAGNFQGWDAGATQMTLAYDDVYEYTTALPLDMCVEYKFIVGPNNWENVPGACAYSSNRIVQVVEGGVVLDPVCWGECVDCSVPEVEVTFQVDMSNEDISPDGIHIAGSFQDPMWQPGDTPMTDAGNGIYTYTTNLPVGIYYEYKFVNGNSWDGTQPEQVPDDCGTFSNRFLTVPDANTDLDVVCFGSCEACVAPPSGGGMETFDNLTASGSSYLTGTFLGQDGSEWSYTQCRGDGTITGKSIMLGKGRTPAANFYSGTIPNGCETIEFDYKQAFSTNVNMDVFINDVLVGNVTSSGEPGAIKNSGSIAVNVSGNFVMKFINTSSSAGQVIVDNISWTGFGSAVSVATPVFSHLSNEYFSPFDLEITCDTEGSTIYYTLDGSDPDDSSTEYTGSIYIDATTTVKAIAYAPDLDPSAISEVNLTFPTVIEVNNLAEFRALYPTDDYIKITGEIILTFQQAYYNQKFLQDATAGVLIYDPAAKITTSYDIYDGITGIIGTIDEFGGMIELVPILDPGAPSSSGNVIVPEVISISDFLGDFEAYESELVQILGVTFEDAGETFETGTLYPISDASKADAMFRTTFYDANYIGTTIPSESADVTGIPNSRFDGDYITSRSLEDIVVPPYLSLIAPNGGEWIEQGSEYAITWESNLNDAFITISLIDDITKAVEILAEGVAVSDLSYTWTVTQALGDNYKISITQEEGKSLGDISADYFSIVPPFDVKITEIMYNTPGQDDWEFIELYNNGEGPVNLLDWKFTEGVDYTFPDHVLNPGEFVVSCINAEAFLNTFGIVAYQWTGGALGNSGEDIELTDNNDSVRAYVDYDDGGNWNPLTDGEGPSLTFCDPTLENNDPANWSASTKFAGLTADGDALYCTPMAGCNTENTLPMFYSYGWTTMSSNLEPAKVTLEDLFTPVNAKMIILLNDMGIYWPVQSINTIGDWDSYKGYKVKFNDGAYFVFSGAEMTNQVFEHGVEMTFVPVLSKDPVALIGLIPQFEGNVEFMFDLETGNVYWPEGLIEPGVAGALETLYPGHAYLTKFTAPGSLDFGAVPTKAYTSSSYVFENTTSWNDVSKTGEQHIISVSETALQGLESGDMIGAFNAQGVCVGMANYSGEETVLPLVVYGDDMTTEAIDGMLEGEMLSFRVYRFGEEINAAAIYNMQIQNHDGLYAENGLSMINEFKLGATGMGEQNNAYSIYPNPGNGQFNIDVAGSYDVTVTNAQGQMVYKRQINGNAVINLSDQSEGIYFIKLTGETSTMIEKVIIK